MFFRSALLLFNRLQAPACKKQLEMVLLKYRLCFYLSLDEDSFTFTDSRVALATVGTWIKKEKIMKNQTYFSLVTPHVERLYPVTTIS